MTWSLQNETLDWPKELKSDTYKKHSKNSAVSNVLSSLDDAEKVAKSIKVPQEQSSNNPHLLEVWKKSVDSTIDGDLKKMAGSLAIVKKRAETALTDKEVDKSKDLKAALASIIKALNENSQSLQASNLKGQANKIFADAEKRQLDVVMKRLGGVMSDIKKVASRKHAGLGTAKKLIEGLDKSTNAKGDLATAANEVRTTARDMATQTIYLLRALKGGASVPGLAPSDTKAIEGMNKFLVPIANSEGDWSGGDVNKFKAGWKDVWAQSQMFDQIAKKLPT